MILKNIKRWTLDLIGDGYKWILVSLLLSIFGTIRLKNILQMPIPLWIVIVLLLTIIFCFLIAIIIHSSKSPKLNEIEKNILLLLEKTSDDNWLTINQIAEYLKTTLTITEFYLTELETKKMIKKILVVSNDFDGDIYTWNLSHEGRRYLIKNKLIKT